jgi:uncharacterized protein YecE (DUF72 family)
MQVIIGTSGWVYSDWNGIFYPEGMKSKDRFSYFTSQFDSVEINNTFYRVPLEKTVRGWYDAAPDGFRYVIKLNRFMTHMKKLSVDAEYDEALHGFFALISLLKEKLAAVLVQLPPSMQADDRRLDYLARKVDGYEREFGMRFPLAIEFRHDSWFNDHTYGLLREYGLANVINDSPGTWPASREVTTDWSYIRFHGNRELYRSSYTDEEMEWWAGSISNFEARCKQVFCYFNNDYGGVAINNARTLKHALGLKVPEEPVIRLF